MAPDSSNVSRSGLRLVTGGSDLQSVVLLISAGPICAACIVRRTGLDEAEIEAVLITVADSVHLTTEPRRCGVCLQHATTFRPSDDSPATDDPRRALPKPPVPMRATLDGALWRFLGEHRGEMFCASCLASAVNSRGRIDRAVIAAEGRGARRQHGWCSHCGKNRLLCGLASV